MRHCGEIYCSVLYSSPRVARSHQDDFLNQRTAYLSVFGCYISMTELDRSVSQFAAHTGTLLKMAPWSEVPAYGRVYPRP